jgi:hypothetical protein
MLYICYTKVNAITIIATQRDANNKDKANKSNSTNMPLKKLQSEYIHFTKGLEQIPPYHREAVQKRLMRILGVTTRASLSRHANAIYRTPYIMQIRIGNEFVKAGIVNWRGGRKKAKATA